jgi:7-cyano-7-deazaguanine synthase
MTKTAVVLWSGGVESTWCVLHYLARGIHVHPVFVDYGQAARRQEYKAVITMLTHVNQHGWGRILPVEVIKITMGMEKHPLLTGSAGPRLAWWSWFLPGRNLTLLSLAGTFAATKGYETLALGVHEPPDDPGVKPLNVPPPPYPDANPVFVALAQSAIQMAIGYTKDHKTLTIETPAMTLRKADGLRRINEYEVNWGRALQHALKRPELTDAHRPGFFVRQLWSCFAGSSHPCGRCYRCEDRNAAWHEVFGEDEAHMQ